MESEVLDITINGVESAKFNLLSGGYGFTVTANGLTVAYAEGYNTYCAFNGHTPVTVTDTQATKTESGLLLIICELCGVELERTVRLGVTSASNANFVRVSNSNKITTITFTVSAVMTDGSTQVRTYEIQIGANNNNIDGKYVFPADHELAGLTLTYDIKGNGSNIKAFSIR